MNLTERHPDYVIWNLRHEACKKCHGQSKTDPCICGGQQPCIKCGDIFLDQVHYDNGCNQCVKKENEPKTVDVEDCHYYISIICPYCEEANLVDGHSGGHHPYADVLQCYSCDKKAWLGVDTSWDYDNDIDKDLVLIEKGLAFKKDN